MNEFLSLMKPELLITIIIFLLLFIKLGKGMNNANLLLLIQVLLLVNLFAGAAFSVEGSLFGGMFKTDALVTVQKNILNGALFLISLLFTDWFKKSDHLAEYFMLMLSSVLGMFFLLSSGNLLLFYLSLELASIPIAAMANFDLHKKNASEAAMKLILTSAFSSGILLFGISLVYGTTGTIQFDAIPAMLTGSGLQVLSFVFLFAAFAFKLSIVPFHLWTADVYEGAPMATTAFLSVISKGAFAFVFTLALYKVFQPLQLVWYNMIMLLSVLSMVVGNLFALRQQNIKRFLAFSSIAQVGFILVGISSNAAEGTTAVVYFVLIYVFSNLAAFAVAGSIESAANKTSIDDYKGLYATNPMLSWMMALALFSLAGIPPTAGFFGKLFLITAGASQANFVYLIIVALNLVVSLYYYLKIIRAIFMEKNENPIAKIQLSFSIKLGLMICGAGILFTGLIGWIYDYIRAVS